MLKSLYVRFLNRRTTVSLIALLAGVYLLGVLIPQKHIMLAKDFEVWQSRWPNMVNVLETLGFTTIYSSPLVLILTATFFLHLILVTWRRVPAFRAAMRLPERTNVTPASFAGLTVRDVVSNEPEFLAQLVDAMRAIGYKVIEGNGSLRGIKNLFSVMGSLLFHVSFLFFLAGGMIIFHSRFSGGAYVTEGQSFHGSEQEYFRTVRFSDFRKTIPEIAFDLLSIKPMFEKNEMVSMATEIVPLVGEKRGKRVVFNVNFPYASGKTTMLIKDVGIAPLFIVHDRAGREVMGAFFSLNVIRGGEDSFAISGTPYVVKTRFWPDYATDSEGRYYTNSYDLKRPLFLLHIMKNDREVANGKLTSPADYVEFDGYRLMFGDIRYFGRFNVTNEYGGEILIAGFIIALCGLVIRFFFEKREVFATITREDETWHARIACKSEHYRGFGPQELERLVKVLDAPAKQ